MEHEAAEKVKELEIERDRLSSRCLELEAALNEQRDREGPIASVRWAWRAARWLLFGRDLSKSVADFTQQLHDRRQLEPAHYSNLATAVLRRVFRVRIFYVFVAIATMVPPTVALWLHAKQIANETYFESRRFLVEPLHQCRSSLRTLRQLVESGAGAAKVSEVLTWTKRLLVETNTGESIVAITLSLLQDIDPSDARAASVQVPGLVDGLQACEHSLMLIAAMREVEIADRLDDFLGFQTISAAQYK